MALVGPNLEPDVTTFQTRFARHCAAIAVGRRRRSALLLDEANELLVRSGRGEQISIPLLTWAERVVRGPLVDDLLIGELRPARDHRPQKRICIVCAGTPGSRIPVPAAIGGCAHVVSHVARTHRHKYGLCTRCATLKPCPACKLEK